MPELVEQMYCSQQIAIPPKFPYILKRYCKAAIKTQPYDLLRWSFEYFLALSQHRTPPVKLRLEYPIYSTEGGLTRGCLKVIANQLSGMTDLPLGLVRSAWQGFCLDPHELRRIFCLCEVYARSCSVPYLHFLATAGGMLTKSLSHTMILLCETLTKEPDGGSAAIPAQEFLQMYKFLASVDASKDVKYINGYREGFAQEEKLLEEIEEESAEEAKTESASSDFWESEEELQKLSLIDDHVPITARLSVKMNMPLIGKIERDPSVERESRKEREAYMRERKGKPATNNEIDEKLRAMSSAKLLKSKIDLPKSDAVEAKTKDSEAKEVPATSAGEVDIYVYDEDENPVQLEIFGQSKGVEIVMRDSRSETIDEDECDAEDKAEKQGAVVKDEIAELIALLYAKREKRRDDLQNTFEEIATLVNRYKAANFDLGMIAGRQMSTTSGEFIVDHIQKEIMDFVDDQIAILPDPDLKKKKARPEEVEMIRDLLKTYFDENEDVIMPELEEIEEEQEPIPEITVVYAVPGIGPAVDEEIVKDFEEYVLDVCRTQADLFMPRNIRHFMCPPLEKYVEYKYDDYPSKKEEVPKEGAITD